MKNLRSVSCLALAAIASCGLAGCADSPARGDNLDYHSRPTSPPQTVTAYPVDDPPTQRLTIQSGEGERLNLPWFIKDTQNWINTR